MGTKKKTQTKKEKEAAANSIKEKIQAKLKERTEENKEIIWEAIEKMAEAGHTIDTIGDTDPDREVDGQDLAQALISRAIYALGKPGNESEEPAFPDGPEGAAWRFFRILQWVMF